MKQLISALGLWLFAATVFAAAEVEQGAYLVTVEPARFADGRELQPPNSVMIARVHDVLGDRRVDFYYGLPFENRMAVSGGRFERTEPYQTTGEGWEGRTPPPSVVAEVNARKLPQTVSGRIDSAKLEGEFGKYWFWWTGDKLDRVELAKHKFHGERIGVESAFIAEGGSEPITEIPYNKPVRVRIRFDRDVPANVQPGYFTWVYLWQNRQRDDSRDNDSRIVTFSARGPREAISTQTFIFAMPGADGVSKATWEKDGWRLVAPPFTALRLLGANGAYHTLRVLPPVAPPAVSGTPPPLQELERPVVRVQAAGTIASVGPGLDAVVEDQPFDIHVFVPAASLPKLANGRTPDPGKAPQSITVRIVKEDDGETTIALRYKGGSLYSTASPITAKNGGGGSAELAGFDFSTILGSTRLTGGIGSIDVPEGGKVTVSYEGDEASFTVHESGTRLALAMYRAAFVTLKADAEHKLRSGGLSEIEQLALVSPEVSDAVKNYLRARTLTALERIALERTVRACDHAFTLIDGDYYNRATTKLLIAENYASMMRAGMGDSLVVGEDAGNLYPDSPSGYGFNYINNREAGAVTYAINQALEERSDVLVRFARDVAVGFYQWTVSMTWAGDAVAIAGINPVTGKPMSRAERIMTVVNAASGLATQAATTAVTKNAMGETVLDFVVGTGSSGNRPTPVGARPSGVKPTSIAVPDDLPPVRFDNIPAATPRPFYNPPGNDSATVRINPPEDNSPTVRINPPVDNSPTVRIAPAGDNAPTIVTRPNPSPDNTPTVRISPPGDNSPTVRINPPGDNSPTVRTPPAGDNSPTIVTRPNPSPDNTPTVRINPPADNAPTVITRPIDADRTPTIVSGRPARAAKPGPPPPAPIAITAERAEARRNRPTLTESERAEHATRNDAALASGRADGQVRGRAAATVRWNCCVPAGNWMTRTRSVFAKTLPPWDCRNRWRRGSRKHVAPAYARTTSRPPSKESNHLGRTPVTTRENALRNLETEIVEARGYTIIGSEEAIRVSGTATRALTGNFTPSDREFVRARVAEARAQGRDWFEDLGRQGTMNYHDGFLPVANTQALAALRKLLAN